MSYTKIFKIIVCDMCRDKLDSEGSLCAQCRGMGKYLSRNIISKQELVELTKDSNTKWSRDIQNRGIKPHKFILHMYCGRGTVVIKPRPIGRHGAIDQYSIQIAWPYSKNEADINDDKGRRRLRLEILLGAL